MTSLADSSKAHSHLMTPNGESHESLLSVEGFHHSKRKSNNSLRLEFDERSRLIANSATGDISYNNYGTSNIEDDINGITLAPKAFYDDFTTIDWIHDSIVESDRRMQLRQIPSLAGKMRRITDGLQGWVLIACTSIAFSGIAYSLDVVESVLSGLKRGYCSEAWYFGETRCSKAEWVEWTDVYASKVYGGLVYTGLSILFALISCFLTLRTRSENPLVEEDGKKSHANTSSGIISDVQLTENKDEHNREHVIFTASGSGVPEVKTILSGVIIRRFLGLKTLICKSIGLLFSISSGLNVGKEGPFVHLSTCVGNILCRYFKKFNNNAIKRRQVLSAAASCGFALAFGSPLGGVLFSLEEVSYYFLPHQLFRIFFCAMMSSLSLKFLDPYGTGKIVPFEVRYPQNSSSFDWKLEETLNFVVIGVVGGLHGALFCKFALFWGKVRKRIGRVKEVFLVALITAVLSNGNRYARMGTSELLFELAAPCSTSDESGLCNISATRPTIITGLLGALAIKLVLTPLSFGLTLPAGIYVPTMVLGALFGRIYGELIGDPLAGVYAMAGAGAFMAGVTRMNITLAVVLFEITGSMPHILLFSVTILVANWVANAVEPLSLYSLLIREHKYPFLENATFAFSNDDLLAEIYTPIDIRKMGIMIGADGSLDNMVLKSRIRHVVSQYMFDACIPITKNDVCVGTIGVAELEYALDEAEKKHRGVECAYRVWKDDFSGIAISPSNFTMIDITPLVDKAPVTLDIHSPLSLVQMVFVKMGARQVCVSDDGKFVGVLHKKRFIEKCSSLLKH